MVLETVKKKVIKKIINLSLNASDKSLIGAIEIGEKFFIRNKDVLNQTKAVKKAFKEKHPSLHLVKTTFNRISSNCRDKIIENFFINAGIFGTQKQKKLEKKLKINMPWFFVISPTAKCNLSCVGCYAHEYVKHKGLSFEEVDRILKEAKQLGIYFITISGGEPFIWPHLFEILKKHNDMYFQIYTNGTLIDKEVAKKLSEIGNVSPAISVEGFEKFTNIRRGEGIFNKIMEAMDNLREAGVIFGFSATVTKINAETLMSDKFIDLMIKKGCSFGWYFQYIPIGKKPDTKLMASPKQRNKLRIRVDEIRNTKPIFIGDFWNDGHHIGGCIAGARHKGYFHINCDGNVEPCVFLQFSVDNIKGKKLIDVIQSPFFKAIQAEQPYCKNKNLLAPCAIIDHPKILRKIIEKYHAKPSYKGGKDLIKDLKVIRFLDKYSKEYQKITNPIWEKMHHKYKHWKDKSPQVIERLKYF